MPEAPNGTRYIGLSRAVLHWRGRGAALPSREHPRVLGFDGDDGNLDILRRTARHSPASRPIPSACQRGGLAKTHQWEQISLEIRCHLENVG